MTTAPVLITPIPRAEPEAFTVPQPARLRLVGPPPQLTIDDIDQVPSADAAPADPLKDDERPGGPTLTQFTRRFFVALAEVMVGRRSAHQLASHLALPIQQWLRALIASRGTAAGPAAPPLVRAVHLCDVRPGVLEATAVIQHGPHVRAMNGRFIELDGRWQCVHLELV